MHTTSVRAIMPGAHWAKAHWAYRTLLVLGFIAVGCLGPSVAMAEVGETLRLNAFDGNPAFLFGNDLPLDAEETAACMADLSVKGAMRQGVAADGVSLVLLEAAAPQAGEWTFRLAPGAAGKLVRADRLDQAAREIKTVRDSRGQHRAFAVYVPPGEFPEDDTPVDRASPKNMAAGGARADNPTGDDPPPIDVQTIGIEGIFHPRANGDSPQTVRYELKLVRPPVVLIHGLYHNPRLAWQTPPPKEIGTSTMQQALESRGFRVFMVDYERTNGRPGTAPSRLRDNQKVVWENPGGIREALQTLRSEGIATTQVDVVGHSMGGLLTRAYIRGFPLPPDNQALSVDGSSGRAMPKHQPEKSWYLRADNFHCGDIRRLITLCTPHSGSDLVRLFVCYGEVCRKLNPEEVQQATYLFKMIESVFSFSSGAILDQEPESAALRELGSSNVPAHAIACTATADDFVHFRAIYRWTFLAMYCFVPTHVWEATFSHDKMGQPEMAKKLVDFLSRHDRLKSGVMMGLLAAYAGREPPSLNDAQLAALQDDAVKLLCEGIFQGSPHDGAVSVRSALGGLPRHATTTLDGILHSWAARYPQVQNRVVELLEGPASNFHADGFPDTAPIASLENAGETRQ